VPRLKFFQQMNQRKETRMKTKVYWLALLASAALISQAQAHGFGGGGAGFGGAHFGGAGFGSGHVGGGPAFHSAPTQSFGGGRMIYGQHLSSVGGMRSPSVTQFHPRVVNSNTGSSVAARQSTPENINRSNGVAQFSNRGNRTITNPQHIRNGVGQVRNRNDTLRPNWRSHVLTQHSANWHHGWDRSRDHWWNGHRCRFINGNWVIFDVGFDPWWPCPGYDDGYPCDDYGY
jgi:hypothetical protein